MFLRFFCIFLHFLGILWVLPGFFDRIRERTGGEMDKISYFFRCRGAHSLEHIMHCIFHTLSPFMMRGESFLLIIISNSTTVWGGFCLYSERIWIFAVSIGEGQKKSVQAAVTSAHTIYNQQKSAEKVTIYLQESKNSSTFAPAFGEKVCSHLCYLTRKTLFFAVKEEESRRPKTTQLISLSQTHLSKKAGYTSSAK